MLISWTTRRAQGTHVIEHTRADAMKEPAGMP
jgi:hypothetical protein